MLSKALKLIKFLEIYDEAICDIDISHDRLIGLRRDDWVYISIASDNMLLIIN